jgi:ketosteroid isomerase-like protein
MPDSALDLMSPACRRPLRKGGAVIAAIALIALSLHLYAGLPQKEENRHQIDKLEDAWRDAVLTANTTSLGSLLSDDYQAITPSGTLQTKDDTLENMRSGRVHFTELDMTDRKVRFYGSTAIVTSQANIQATTAEGAVTGHYWYTRVYARDAKGQWKIVSFEASRVREPGPHRHIELH